MKKMTTKMEMTPEESRPLTHEERWKKHLAIERRYLGIMHTLVGRVWDIPECCIKQFVEDTRYGIMSAQYRQLKHQKMIPPQIGYVPCDDCMKKL